MAANPRQPPIARRGLALLASTVCAVLVAFSARYGYHRDELYFLRAGRELAFGYVDQPPLTPAVARVASAVFGDSLVGLRLPSAIAAAAVVLLTGLIARELGAERSAQLLAAATMSVAAYLLRRRAVGAAARPRRHRVGCAAPGAARSSGRSSSSASSPRSVSPATGPPRADANRYTARVRVIKHA